MATWKKIITAADKMSALVDVSAAGSANGQFLIYNNSSAVFTPALITEGTYTTMTPVSAGLTIDVSNANIIDRLGTMTNSEIDIGADSQTGNDYPINMHGGHTHLLSGKIKSPAATVFGIEPIAATGENTAGTAINIATGKGTGTGTPGRISFYTSETLGTGTTSQSLNAKLSIIGNATDGSVVVAAGEIELTASATSIKFSSDMSTPAAVDWDLLDNSTSALSFDASGKAGILELVTTNSSEKVAMSGDLTVAGLATIADLTVTGTTTTINTTNLDVQDAVIKIANVASPTVDTADGAGIEVEHSDNATKYPSLKWTKAQGGGNTDGTGLLVGLTGWGLKNARTSNAASSPIAVMDFKTDTGAPTGNSQGQGSFCYNTEDDALYIRTI